LLSVEDWAEIRRLYRSERMPAVHLLELALLAYIGYRGQIHPRITAIRSPGYTEDVPWLGC